MFSFYLFSTPHLNISFTWTGGRAAGLFYSWARSHNHSRDFWCSGAVWHSEGRPHPQPALLHDLFACPLSCSQHQLGKEHQGQLHQQHALLPRQPHRLVPQWSRDSSLSNNTTQGSSSKNLLTSIKVLLLLFFRLSPHHDLTLRLFLGLLYTSSKNNLHWPCLYIKTLICGIWRNQNIWFSIIEAPYCKQWFYSISMLIKEHRYLYR